MKVGVAVIGDVLDINCWSNIPYYFYNTGAKIGLFHNPFRLNPSLLSLQQKIWNIKQLLKGKNIGGYQFSRSFQASAETQIPKEFFSEKVISFSQVFPRGRTVIEAGGEIYYYIDTSLYDLFRLTSYKLRISKSARNEAIELEMENYQSATKIVTMGTWARKSLLDYYNLPENKIETILPGANLVLPAEYSPPKWRAGAGINRDFVLGFVGKDWNRKGLPILIKIKNSLKEQGLRIKVKVIGDAPEYIRKDPDVDFLGFIDKLKSPEKFAMELSTCDLGCLFSSGEALGISTLEFIKAGIPVAGFYQQGLKDTLFEGISLRFDPEEDFDVITKRLFEYILNPLDQISFFSDIPNYRNSVTWENCIDKWAHILQNEPVLIS